MVGSAFSATLTKSQDDRVRYDVGADIRIQHDSGRIARAFTGASETLPGGAEAMRTEGSLLTEGFGSQRVSVLAVESDRLADVAWWRDDFGDGKSLPELMALISPDPNAPEGLRLPEGITGLSLWARTGGLQERLVAVSARLRDGSGRHYDVRMGDVSGHEWERLEGDVALRLGRTGRRTEDESRPRLDVPPYTLINVQIVGRTSADRPGVLFMDGLTAQTPQGDVLISDLISSDGWTVIEDYVRPGLYSLETSRNVARPGADGSVVFSWGARRHWSPRFAPRRNIATAPGGGEPRNPGRHRRGGW